MYALLIAKDEDEIAVFSTILQRVGLAVTTAKDMEWAMQTWTERPSDIILAVLSDQEAHEQVRRIRAETIVPLILKIQSADESLHCELLSLGADLVIVPPFSPKLLITQISVLMRRAGGVSVQSLPTLSAPDLTLNPETRTIEVVGRPKQRLTHLEFRLLYTLMMNRGQIIPTERIVEHVWGYTGQGDRDLIRGLVSRLRAKIEADPRKPQYIQTTPGIGYSFMSENE